MDLTYVKNRPFESLGIECVLIKKLRLLQAIPTSSVAFGKQVGIHVFVFFSRSFCGKNSGDVISFSGLMRIIFSFFSGMLHQGDCFTLR